MHRGVTLCHVLAVVSFGLSTVGSLARANVSDKATRISAVEKVPFALIASAELEELKTMLEASGWPAAHVRALLEAEVQRRFDPEESLRAQDLKPFHFWHTGSDALPIAHRNTRERIQERAEREALARAKFDALFPVASGESELLRQWEEERRWGELSPDKRATVQHILDRAEKARGLFLEQRGHMLQGPEWFQLWEANRTTRRELERALTPDELLDYDLRNSSTAAQMRNELDTFAPTREEFVAIFRCRHPLELEFQDKPRGISADIDASREAAETATVEQIAALLGPERYDDYRISLDPVCQTLRFDARHARVDAATVRQLFRTFIAAKQRSLGANTLPHAEREAMINTIKAELHREFRKHFDEETTRRFLQEQALWP